MVAVNIKKAQTSLPEGRYFFSGNEAVAEGALSAGCNFYGGYPITPSSEIMERMAARLPDVGGVFIQMEDEIASIASVIGASWAGAKAMTATSGPGFSLMQEGIGYAAFTEAPCVVVDIQRAGPSTGQATKVGSGDLMQAKWGSHGDYLPIVLTPWSVQEMFDLTIRAFNLAERFRTPVFLMGEEATAHLREGLYIPSEIDVIERNREPGPPFGTDKIDETPPMPVFGDGQKLLVTGSTHDRWGFRKTDDPETHRLLVEHLHQKILNHRDEIVQTEEYHLEDAEIGIIAYGFTARSALFTVEKLRKEGLPIGMLRLQTLWPFPHEGIESLTKKLTHCFTFEMNRGQISGEIQKTCGCPLHVTSQINGVIISPATIEKKIREVIQ
jgi:2-oxoglutarate ferredoxin oxidoreductase subunit alpha